MSRKRDRIKGFLGLKGTSASLTPAPASASVVGSSVPMAVLPTGITLAPVTVSVSQSPTPTTWNNPNIDKARTWWREHREGLMSSLESTLTIAEKALVVVPPAQAVVGAAGAALKDLRLMDENNTTIEEIANRVDEIIADLVGLTLPSSVALPASIPPDAVVRIHKFNERLSKIKTSVTGHVTTTRSFLQRLLNAERISEELDDAWKDVSLAYDDLIGATVLGTEAKVVGVHARVEDVHNRVENVHERVEHIHERVEHVHGNMSNVRDLVDNVQRSQTSQKEETLLDRLQPVKSAFHDAHGSAPACLEGTRAQLLDEISAWMEDPSAKLVYWLTGVAGTGKTTIAESVAYMAADQKCLAATFFFSRTSGSAERRRAAAVIPTVAYQLAYRHRMFYDCICDAISTDRDVCERQVAMQAKTLLSDALGGSPRSLPLPLLIVLDALDECDKESGREGGDLIPVLLHSLDKLPFSVKLFVTSRPEPSVKNMFNRADIHGSTVGLALHRDIEQSIVREDIGRYLRHELEKLAQDRSVPHPFPSDTDFQTLVDRAGNLFIYVRTIVIYVSSDVEDPVDQLADVLCANADRSSEQFAELDALYTQILTKALEGVGRSATAQHQLRDLLASLVLVQENLPVAAVAALTGIKERQCKMILRCLSSVLLYEHTSHEPVRLMHPSFPDFLTHEGRCTDARCFVSSAKYHSLLALRCLKIMNEDLRRDICELWGCFLLNSDIPDLDQRLDRNVSVQLRYACKYWHVHVQSAGCFSPDLITALDIFCTRHLLHWLELLSLMNEVHVALRDLPSLLIYLEKYDEMHQGRTRTLLADVDRLLLAYRLPIIEGALHVYWSGLVTMPSCLLLEETAPHDSHGIPLLVTKRAPGWGLRETVVEAKSQVNYIAYSPNGKLIASVGRNVLVQVWDVMTGTTLHTMSVSDTGVSNSVVHFTSVAFSPNSQWIVSGGQDHNVRLWNVVTGGQHHVMNGHTNWVTCVAFSPDGTIIASCSHDSTLRFWDTGTGIERLVVRGHTAQVNSIAFAPNGRTVVSASSDGTLRVWDVLVGIELRIMEGGDCRLWCVAFSPDGATIASGSSNGALQLWCATNSTCQHALKGGMGSIRALTFSPDSRSIVSCDGSGLARIWDATTGIEKRRLRENVVTAAYSPDGNSIAMGLWTGTIRIWDANSSVVAHPIPEGYYVEINSVAFSHDGLLIASGSDDHTVRVCDAITGTERHVMKVGDPVYSIAFSPDNTIIACGQSNGTVQVWDVASGLKRSSMMGQHAYAVRSVAFSSDGKSIVSYSSRDGIAQVWDVTTTIGAEWRRILMVSDAHSLSDNESVAFSVDGKTIVVRESYGSRTVTGFWKPAATQPEHTDSTSLHNRTPTFDDPHAFEQHYFEGYHSVWIRHRVGWQEKPKYVCWLPQERRGVLAYSGMKVCVGGEDGLITILDFANVGLPQ